MADRIPQRMVAKRVKAACGMLAKAGYKPVQAKAPRHILHALITILCNRINPANPDVVLRNSESITRRLARIPHFSYSKQDYKPDGGQLFSRCPACPFPPDLSPCCSSPTQTASEPSPDAICAQDSTPKHTNKMSSAGDCPELS